MLRWPGEAAVHDSYREGLPPLPETRDLPLEPATRIRVGVLVDGRRIPRWQLACLTHIDRVPFSQLTVFVAQRPRRRLLGRRPRAFRPDRFRAAFRSILYRAYERADRRRFAADDDPLELVALDDSVGTRRAAVELDREGRPSPSGVARIATEQLDVLICLAATPELAGLASTAREGVWFPCVGGARGLRDEAPLFRETLHGDELSVTTLRALDRDGRERTLYRTSTWTDPVSLYRNRRTSYRKVAQLPFRCLRDLHLLGGTPLADPLGADDGSPGRRHAKPGNALMVRFLWRVGSRVLGHRVEALLYEEQWYVAFRRRQETRATAGSGASFTCLTPPPGRYYADPFLLFRDGRHFLFFEDYDYAADRGVISYVEIDDEGRHSAPQLALECDFHLSYPFLFCEGDEVYMLPETGWHRTVELYRARRFPAEWELDRVLLEDIEARDPTLLRHRGVLWLFTAVSVGPGAPADELALFSAESLHGEWRPHPMNPVGSDIRCARPAGSIFADGDRLIRPAQDGSRTYGWRLVFEQIDRLDESGYGEAPVGRIEPVGPTPSLRTHTYTADGLYEAVDGFRLRPRIRLPRRGWGEERFRIELRPRASRLEDADVLALEPREERPTGVDRVEDVRTS